MDEERVKTKVVSSGGVGLTSILTVIFVIFKLLGIINWSWWWVFAPIWISWAIILGLLFIIGIVLFILALFDK